MYIKEINEQQFNKFMQKYDNSSIYQTVEYAYTMKNQKFDIMILGLEDNNTIVGATIILVEKLSGFKYAYAPRGFLIDYDNFELVETFTTEIKKYLGKKEIMAIKINPLINRTVYNSITKKKDFNGDHDLTLNRLRKLGYTHLGYNNMFEALKPRFESVIDISIPYQNVFLNFKKELKTKIKNAEANGLKVYKGNEDKLEYLYLQTKKKYPRDLEYFKDMYGEFKKNDQIDLFYIKLDTKVYLNKIKSNYEKHENMSHEINQKIISNLKNKDKLVSRKIDIDNKMARYKEELINATKLLSKSPEGIVLASALIIKHKKSVNLIMDGYDLNYKNLNAKHLLLWRLIEHYNKQGFETFNLGGMTNLVDENKFSGLNKFKLSFSPSVFEYMGDLELVTNQTAYFMYRHSRPLTTILKK
jgi:peptidoglycan pentaglycine glycine transferase (the first glycine)